MKRIYKISINLLMFGWVPLLLVAGTSKHMSDDLNITLLIIGVILCMFGSILSMTFSTYSSFWKSLEELEELKQKHRESIDGYNNAKDKLIEQILTIKKNN